MRPPLKIWLQNIGLIVFGLLIAFILTEIALRLVIRDTSSELNGMLNYFEKDEMAGYDIQKDREPRDNVVDGLHFSAWSNNLGCFDDPYKGEDVSMLLIGDSFTWGFTPFEKKWGTELQNLFDERVVKCGVSGYGTKQQLLKAEKILPQIKKPKLMIVAYVMNDLPEDYVFPNNTVESGALIATSYLEDVKTGEITKADLSKLAEKAEERQKCIAADYNVHPLLLKVICAASKTKTYTVAKPALKNLYFKFFGEEAASNLVSAEHKSFWQLGFITFLPEKDYPWVTKAWDNHFENIKAIKKLAAEENTKLLFVVIPVKENIYPFLNKRPSPFVPKEVDFDYPYTKLIPFFEREKITYLNLLDSFRAHANTSTRKHLDSVNDLYFDNDGHWNEKGNELAGLEIAKFIVEKNLLPQSAAKKTELLKEVITRLADLK